MLRDYQQRGVDEAWQATSAGERPIVVAPTGSGKTYMAGALTAKAHSEHLRTAILTPRREILQQTIEKTQLFGIRPDEIGVLMGAQTRGRYRPIQVVSWSTLNRRASKSEAALPIADLLLIDEAHLSLTPKLKSRVLDYYADKGSLIVGMTATPARKSGFGLGDFYTTLIETVSVSELVERGLLAPPIYYGGSNADMARVKVIAGDWNMAQASERSRLPVLIGDVVQNWLRRAAERHTIAFCCDIRHAHALAERFLRQGVAAGVVTDKTPQAERDEIIQQFRDKQLQVLCNVLVGCYGLDIPSIDCVILARPTRSIPLHLQMLGRGLRADEGKRDCLVLDHAANITRLGMAEEDRHWTLDAGRRIEYTKASSKRAKEDTPITCKECSYIFRASRECPRCGWTLPVPKRDVNHVEAELVRITRQRRMEFEDRRRFYLELRTLTMERGYKPGYAKVNFKEKFGDWPDRSWDDLPLMPVSDGVRRYVKSRQIAFAKARAANGQR